MGKTKFLLEVGKNWGPLQCDYPSNSPFTPIVLVPILQARDVFNQRKGECEFQAQAQAHEIIKIYTQVYFENSMLTVILLRKIFSEMKLKLVQTVIT